MIDENNKRLHGVGDPTYNSTEWCSSVASSGHNRFDGDIAIGSNPAPGRSILYPNGQGNACGRSLSSFSSNGLHWLSH